MPRYYSTAIFVAISPVYIYREYTQWDELIYGDEAVIIINVDADPRSVTLPIVIENFDWIQMHKHLVILIETTLWSVDTIQQCF